MKLIYLTVDLHLASSNYKVYSEDRNFKSVKALFSAASSLEAPSSQNSPTGPPARNREAVNSVYGITVPTGPAVGGAWAPGHHPEASSGRDVGSRPLEDTGSCLH